MITVETSAPALSEEMGADFHLQVGYGSWAFNITLPWDGTFGTRSVIEHVSRISRELQRPHRPADIFEINYVYDPLKDYNIHLRKDPLSNLMIYGQVLHDQSYVERDPRNGLIFVGCKPLSENTYGNLLQEIREISRENRQRYSHNP